MSTTTSPIVSIKNEVREEKRKEEFKQQQQFAFKRATIPVKKTKAAAAGGAR